MTESPNLHTLIQRLIEPSTRESALSELSKQRERVPDLAMMLWRTPAVVAVLLQEILAIYPLLSPPSFGSQASTRVCDALALLQCIASNEETRSSFLQAHLPLYLYPLLNTSSKTRPFEYLRLTSLGVIGALVKNDSSEVTDFLLSTEIIPLCLRIMETGNELSRTVAIFIVQKILLDNLGLNYVCQTYERFHAIVAVLETLTSQLGDQKSLRLLKHVIRCYLRLTDNRRALDALRQCLPDAIRNGAFGEMMEEDSATKKCAAELLARIDSAEKRGS